VDKWRNDVVGVFPKAVKLPGWPAPRAFNGMLDRSAKCKRNRAHVIGGLGRLRADSGDSE
jgi:hypothetical protein